MDHFPQMTFERVLVSGKNAAVKENPSFKNLPDLNGKR